jgi:8-oxo-dGTP diphosphatase
MAEEGPHNYDPARYERPSVTVDVVIFTLIERQLHVLLVQRKRWPYEGFWAIPGGFVNMDESLEEAARRELEEETGVRDVYLEQLYTFGTPGRDPRTRVISVAYFALIGADTQTLRLSDETSDLRWFSVESLPKPLAFDHDAILEAALDRLRSKLEYTTLAFQLLPEEFTLSELQEVYECILGERLDKRNFRRKVEGAPDRTLSGIVEPTGRLRYGKGRPAELYRFRNEGRSEFVFRWREAK